MRTCDISRACPQKRARESCKSSAMKLSMSMRTRCWCGRRLRTQASCAPVIPTLKRRTSDRGRNVASSRQGVSGSRPSRDSLMGRKVGRPQSSGQEGQTSRPRCRQGGSHQRLADAETCETGLGEQDLFQGQRRQGICGLCHAHPERWLG